MAVIFCERKSNLKYNEDQAKSEFSEEYIIGTNSDNDEPATIKTDTFPTIPRVGDTHPIDTTAKVIRRSVDATDNRRYWIMTVTYSDSQTSDSGGGGGGGGGGISVLSVDLDEWMEQYIQDYRLDGQGGKPIPLVNSADQPILWEAERPQVLLTISALTDNPGLGELINLVNTVNDATVTWLGMRFAKGQLMFANYRASNSGGTKWQESFIFKGKIYNAPIDYNNQADRQGGWQPFILNAGLMEWKQNEEGQKELVPIYPKESDDSKPSNTPVSEPWPLDDAGVALSRKEIKERANYINPQMFTYADFSRFRFNFTDLLSRDKQKQLGLR